MKKTSVIIEELFIWFRGRFTLTAEEKRWVLLILFICFTGLTARYFYLKNKPLASMPAEINLPAE